MVAFSQNFPSDRSVYAVLDSSNILHSAVLPSALARDGSISSGHVRIELKNFQLLMQRSRDWLGGFAAAGVDRYTSLERHYREAGFEFQPCERGRLTNTEQGVDQILQQRMAYCRRTMQPGSTLLLATGDGAGADRLEGFVPELQELHQAGIQIEVMSWKHSLSTALRTFATAHGKLILLDDWFEYITYVPGGRWARSQQDLARQISRHFGRN